MSVGSHNQAWAIDRIGMPDKFPTHAHPSEFWEALGRAVATFGFLEDILGRAIFALTAMRTVAEDDINSELDRWAKTLQRALDDPLGPLINAYDKAVREYSDAPPSYLESLVGELKRVAKWRNVLCHASWPPLDANGSCVPRYVDKKDGIITTTVDIAFLQKIRSGSSELIFRVIDSVTNKGLQFPGSNGPGKPIW